jgi:hypothetical protein
MNDYENIVSTDFSDVKGVYDFLSKYLYPAIDPDCVIYGNQNNITLPPDTNEYCIFYIENGMQSATTIEEYDPEKELLTLHGKKEIIVRVDCYAKSENGQINDIALQRAQNLQTIFRSSVGVRQFKEIGLVPLFADDPNDTTLNSNDSENYLFRWTIKLHCYLNHSITVNEEGFNKVPKIKLNSILPHDQQPLDQGDTLHLSNIDIKIKDSE